MTHDQTDQIVRRANPVPDPRALEGRVDVAAPIVDPATDLDDRLAIVRTVVVLDTEPAGTERTRRRSRLFAAAAAAIVAIIVGAIVLLARHDGTESPAPVDQPQRPEGVGLVGLPPAGATPSTPASAEAVFDLASCITPFGDDPGPAIDEPRAMSGWSGGLTVLADGRLIWMQYADVPQGANPYFTGLLEQRLTPEGVALMRSEFIATGLLDTEHRDCAAGSLYHGHLYENGERPAQVLTAGANEHLAKITDPESWLPAGAWEDREIKAFVPSQYSIVILNGTASSLAPELPAAAQELVLAKRWECQANPDGSRSACYAAGFTTDEARALAAALEDAGFVQHEPAYELVYRPTRESLPASEAEESGTLMQISFSPLLPHQLGRP